MSKLDPSQIHQVLKETNLAKTNSAESTDFKDLLDRAGLSADEVLDSIGSVMRGGENDQVRLRAADLATKLHGWLQTDQGGNIPHVTIVIKDSQVGNINPILIPR
jgi:hypothetical protein